MFKAAMPADVCPAHGDAAHASIGGGGFLLCHGKIDVNAVELWPDGVRVEPRIVAK